jgi:hypothetical protein
MSAKLLSDPPKSNIDKNADIKKPTKFQQNAQKQLN